MNRKMLIVFLSVVFFSKPSSDDIMIGIAPGVAVCVVAGIGYLVSQCRVIGNLRKRVERAEGQSAQLLANWIQISHENAYTAMAARQIQPHASAASLPPYNFSESAVLEVSSLERVQEISLAAREDENVAQESNEIEHFFQSFQPHLFVWSNQQHDQIIQEELLGLLPPIAPLHRINITEAQRDFCILDMHSSTSDDQNSIEMCNLELGQHSVN